MELVDGEIILHGNDSALGHFLGYSPKVLKDKPFLNFICPEDLDIARESISNIIDGQNVKDVSVRLVKLDESRTKKLSFLQLLKEIHGSGLQKRRLWISKSAALNLVLINKSSSRFPLKIPGSFTFYLFLSSFVN